MRRRKGRAERWPVLETCQLHAAYENGCHENVIQITF